MEMCAQQNERIAQLKSRIKALLADDPVNNLKSIIELVAELDGIQPGSSEEGNQN